MNDGRSYPTALTLPDGNALVISGSANNYVPDKVPQIWQQDEWLTAPRSPQQSTLYPKLHLESKGRVFVAGPQAESQLLDLDARHASTNKRMLFWAQDGPERTAGAREYGSSVTYDSGKVLFAGGGNAAETTAQGTKIRPDDGGPPTNITETIDLNSTDRLEWVQSGDMQFPRRQFNVTVLPDGTVLATGGTKGPKFNDLNSTVRQAELWSPATRTWTPMALKGADRMCHSIALLLPDGQVLSAGGGECNDVHEGDGNATKAQLFSPPYLCQSDPPKRPTIQPITPTDVGNGETITVPVGTGDPNSIAKVSWVRLGSVTHTTNMNQSLTFLKFTQNGTKITITAPANANIAPPGHYMLFLLNQQGIPCIAPILKLKLPGGNQSGTGTRNIKQRVMMATQPALSLPELNKKLIAEQDKPPVVVDLTPVCPYGLGPCWGGAHEALQRIIDVDVVRPVADQEDSVAFVYLKQDTLPDIDVWRKEFASTAHGAYQMCGIEMTLTGTVEEKKVDGEEQLVLAGTDTRPELPLKLFTEASNLKFDIKERATKPITEAEANVHKELSAALEGHDSGRKVQVVGTLHKHDDTSSPLMFVGLRSRILEVVLSVDENQFANDVNE
jgi:galactose oxidase